MSKNTTAPRGKSASIALELRTRIARGQWKPGQRLPNRTDLTDEFATTPATIQKAVNVLLAEGLVEAHGRNGTFVADNLPHLSRIGIALPCAPSQPERWRRMYAAVDEAARRLIHGGSRDLQIYYDTAHPEAPGFQQLIEDIAAHRLAGLYIMGMGVDTFAGTPVLASAALPIATSGRPPPGGIQAGAAPWLPPAIDVLRREGRRRVALVYSPQASELPDNLRNELQRHGMESHPNWSIPVWPSSAQAARAATYLLLRQPAPERPDAILIGDDYLVEETTRGILDAGVPVPEAVQVIALCNYPYAPPAVTPIHKLGVDHGRILEEAVAALLAPESPRQLTVPLVSEAEWRAREAATAQQSNRPEATRALPMAQMPGVAP